MVMGVCLLYVKWEERGKKGEKKVCNYMFCAERCGHWRRDWFQPQPHRQMLREAAFVAAADTQRGAANS